MDRRTRDQWSRKGIEVGENDLGFVEIYHNTNSRNNSDSIGDEIYSQLDDIFGKPVRAYEDICTLPITLNTKTCYGIVDFTRNYGKFILTLNLCYIFPQHRGNGIFSRVMKRVYDELVVVLQPQPITLHLQDIPNKYYTPCSCLEEYTKLDLNEKHISERKDELLEKYVSLGYKQCSIVGSSKVFVTNLPSELKGLVHYS